MLGRKLTTWGLAMLLGGAGMTAAAPALATPEIKLRGRMHLDGALWNEDNVPLHDSVFLRRTRIGVTGRIDDVWSGIIEYDFAENGTSANDVMINRKLGVGTLKIGQFKVPMGLNELTSSNSILLIERSTPSNLIADSRRIGIGYDWFAGDFGFQGMLYGRAIGAGQGGDTPLGLGGRFVYAPKLSDDSFFHFGLSAAWEDRRDDNVLRFRDRPEARPGGGVRLIDTGNITDVDDTFKYGVELAYQAGPFSVEAEYLSVDVSRAAGAEPGFSGYHLQASWVLTGEKRSYRNGVFRGVAPAQAGRGAWELAARYSHADLIDAGFLGGEQDNFTLGLNYYASANVRFMLNYLYIDVSDSTAVANGVVVGNDNPHVVLARAQFHF
jgi:phosphate-selective porin OprO and OprP